MRKGLLVTWLCCVFFTICFVFWRTELVYSLPTKVPPAYVPVATNKQVQLPFSFNNQKPVFLHFFNPDCPCSRFNMAHVKSLIVKYGKQVNFVMVLITDDENYAEQKVKKKYGIDVPVYRDSNIAVATGVYSTPQAVILTAAGNIYYKGNYNRSRYCANKKTNYAEKSLQTLLLSQQRPVYDHFALKAYGCSLPR